MLIINVAGLALIALIIWWFWIFHPRQAEASADALVVSVENGTYTPSHIRLVADQPTELRFMRKDPSPCAEMVVIPALDISETLPVNKVTVVKLPAMKPGDYDFHCQMQMYRGQLHVE